MINTIYVVLILLETLATGQSSDFDCNDGKGECKFLSDCPPIAHKFDTNPSFNIPFCDGLDNYVCCPRKIQRINTPYHEDKSKVFVRECLNYQNMLYKKCDPTPLIINGEKAAPKEFPHMALLGEKLEDNTIKWLCGGTLVSPKYVVTAAHCFYSDGNPTVVRLGELDYSATNPNQTQDFGIKINITHPEYDYMKRYNDIALIQLDRLATFTDYVAPACLPVRNGSEFNQFIATGWGTTRDEANSPHLLKVRLDRFDDADCQDLVDDDDLERGVHAPTQICAGSMKSNSDTCTGDSGGPLFVQHPDYPCMFLLVGITSFGRGCGIPGQPGVYVRVNLYVDWLEKIIWNVAGTI